MSTGLANVNRPSKGALRVWAALLALGGPQACIENDEGALSEAATSAAALDASDRAQTPVEVDASSSDAAWSSAELDAGSGLGAEEGGAMGPPIDTGHPGVPGAVDAGFTDAADGSRPVDLRWVTTWSTTLVEESPPSASFRQVTLRQVAHTSIGGGQLRVRFSNHFGKTPLRLGAVHVARRATGASIVAATDRLLTFNGASSASVPAGQVVTSDAIAFEVAELSDLSVSIDLPEDTAGETAHSSAPQTSYVSGQGSSAASAELPGATPVPGVYFLAGVEVTAAPGTPCVVALGASATEGVGSTVDANRSWPDDLARRAIGAGLSLAVVNQGYGGNQLVADGLGESGVSRFARDVLGNTGATHVVLYEGFNDLALSDASFDALKGGYQQIIAQGHAAGLKVIGATLGPTEILLYLPTDGSNTRKAVNQWILSSGAFDAVIDFDRVLRDPDAPELLMSAYDSGDSLHPNDTGYKALADAIDLGLFR